MIKCKNKCPYNKHDGCCVGCADKETCDEVCEQAVNVGECDDAIFDEESSMVTFEAKTLSVMQAIKNIAIQKKELEEQEKAMRESLEAAMEKYDVKSFENDILKITYVAPTTRTSIDSKKLKEHHPDIFEKFSKTSDVKASVKITVK